MKHRRTMWFTVQAVRPRQAEAESFVDVVTLTVRLAGDCIGPRRINEVVHEGYFAGSFIV